MPCLLTAYGPKQIKPGGDRAQETLPAQEALEVP